MATATDDEVDIDAETAAEKKRREDEAALIEQLDLEDASDLGDDTPEAEAAGTPYGRKRKGPNYVLTPVEVPKEEPAATTVPTPSPEAPLEIPTPTPESPSGAVNLKTDEETGLRYAEDQGVRIPHAELATPQEKEEFKPSDVTLPRETVTATPRVERAIGVTEPWHPAEPVDVGRLGDEEFIRQALAEAPEPTPGFIEGSPNAILNPAAVRTERAQQVYPTIAEDQPGPPLPPNIERAQPVIRGEAPKPVPADLAQGPPGTHPAGTEAQPYWPKSVDQVKLYPPGSVYIDPTDGSVKTTPGEVRRGAVVGETPKAEPAAPLPEAKPAAPKAPFSRFGPTQEEYDAAISGKVQTAAAKTDVDTGAAPPPINAPNGKPPVALIIHHTSGRNSAASVVEDWRANRPGVGAQMIMDRDGTIHYTQKEFGYGGTGNFLHSVIPGVSNQTAVGIEVIAKDDADMTPAQIESLKRLGGPGGSFANVKVYGHSQVSPGDRDNEGVRGVNAINEARRAGGQQPSAAIAEDKNYVTGTATTFGYKDRGDSGVGAPKLGHLSTNNKDLIGLALPEGVLRSYISAHPADWRRARVEVVTEDGRSVMVPIVDLGPFDTSKNASDFTQGLTNMLGNTGEQQYKFRIIQNAGPDVMKNPQAFADEQAAIREGIVKAPPLGGVKKRGNYVLTPVDEGTPAVKVAREQADQFAQTSQVDTMDELNRTTENPGQFWKLIQHPMPGKLDPASGQMVGAVSEPMRKAYAQNFKEQFTKYAQEFYGEKDANKAFARGVGDSSIGAFTQNFWNSAVGTLGQVDVGLNKAAKDIDFNRLESFAIMLHPEADGAGRAAFIKTLTDIKDPNARARAIGKLWANLEPAKQQLIDINGLADAADRVADPKYQAWQTGEIAKKEAFIKRLFAADPTLRGTPGEWWSGQAGALLTNTALAYLAPVLRVNAFGAQIYGTSRDRIKADHPEWTDEQVVAEAGKSTFLQLAPQEALMAASHGVLGPLMKWGANPVVRFGIGGGVHLATGAAGGAIMKAGENIAEHKDLGEGVGEAALAGAGQAAPFAVHGAVHALTHPPPPRGATGATTAPVMVHEGEVPPAPPPEAQPTTGAKGAPATGPRTSTLEAQAQPQAVGVDERGNVQTVQQGRSSTRVTVREMLNAGGDSAVKANEALKAGHGLDDPMPKPGEPAPQGGGFPTPAHAAVYNDLVARGMDEARARTLVARARGGTAADILTDIQTQMRSEAATVAPETMSDQNIEQRNIPTHNPEEGMTEEEAHAFLDGVSKDIERRHQARASDMGLTPSDDHPQATVHSDLGDQGAPPAVSEAEARPTVEEAPREPVPVDLEGTIKAEKTKAQLAKERLKSYRGETDEDLASAAAVGDTFAERVLKERYPKKYPKQVSDILGAKDAEAAAEAAHRAEMQGEATRPEGQDHLLQAIVKAGGLPTPVRMRSMAKKGEVMTGEVARVHDAWRSLSIDAKKRLARDGVTYNKLFRNDALPLDEFRGNLAQHPDGFGYSNVGDLLAQAEHALSQAEQGKRVFGTGPEGKMSVRGGPRGRGLTRDQAQRVADEVNRQLPNAPRIKVVESRNELPAGLREQVQAAAGHANVEAIAHGKDIYAIASENHSAEGLTKALLEEAIGHYGVENVLGDKFSGLVDLVNRTMRGRPEYEALRKLYGNDPRTLAAEYIAKLARGEIRDPTMWDHIKVWFNRLARSLGFNEPFTDAELRSALSRARDAVSDKGGGRVSAPVPRLSMAAHPEGEFNLEMQQARAARKRKLAIQRGTPTEFRFSEPEGFKLEQETTGAPPPEVPPPKDTTGDLFGGQAKFSLAEKEKAKAKAIIVRKPVKGEMKGANWIKSAYDSLSQNPHTAPLAVGVMHWVDRAHEVRAGLDSPIRRAFREAQKSGIKKKEMRKVLEDVGKIQDARDNKQPVPSGLHPAAYKILEGIKTSAKMSERLAIQNKVLVHDPRLIVGNDVGGYRPFRAVSDYVPRNVKREIIDIMRMRHSADALAINREASRLKNLGKWNDLVHEFIDKNYANSEAEVLDLIKGAANLDTKHVDKKLGNLEKSRVNRLPSNMYEYSLTGMLDYNHRISDRMAEIEAFGQRGEMFQKALDRINASPIAGTDTARGLENYIKHLRNHILGLNEPTNVGKGLATLRSFATGMDLSGWMGMLQDTIGSSLQTPTHLGLWNTAKGFYHGLTHLKKMMHESEDLGVIHDDMGRSVKEIDHDYQSGSLSDTMARFGSTVAEKGLMISGRTASEKFIRTLTLSAAKTALRDMVKTIRANPESRRARAWLHYMHRRGADVTKLVAENGQGGEGSETNRFLRRTVADIQAGYDLIQRSPLQETTAGKFFGQYLSWATNQTRNVMREIMLPMFRPKQKTITVEVNGRQYTVKDSRFVAVQRGLMLMVAGAATGLVNDQNREFFLGRINSYRDLKQLAADIASNPDKTDVFMHAMWAGYNAILNGGMLGSVGNVLQLAQDPFDRNRFKDPMHPTAYSKIESLWGAFRRMAQEGQFNSHEMDNLLRNWMGVYREGKPVAARALSTLGYSPNWVKEERTRETVTALRNTLKRFNDEEQLGIKPRGTSDVPDASRNTPIAQSITDALYRGDAVQALKIQTDFLDTAKDASARAKIAKSLDASIRAQQPLKLGSTSNKDFQAAFWEWARKEGNVTESRLAEFQKLVNIYNRTAYDAGFGKKLLQVEDEGGPVVSEKRGITPIKEFLKEKIKEEQDKKELQPQ